MASKISSEDEETILFIKKMENYYFRFTCSTVRVDTKNNYLLRHGHNFVGEYRPEKRQLRIKTIEVEGEVQFKLTQEEHEKMLKALKMREADKPLPADL